MEKQQRIPAHSANPAPQAIYEPPNQDRFTVFNNPQFGQVRTVMVENEPWFVAVDVCRAFGATNSRNMTARLDEDEKGVQIVDTLGGKQQVSIVSEAGLYHMMFTMEPNNARNTHDAEIAERIERLHTFKRWITHDVIPSLRKHGVYAVDKMLDDPDAMIAALTAFKEEREKRREAERLAAENSLLIEEMLPKASYYDLVLKSSNAVPITMIAKDYGLSARRFNEILHELAVQFKMDGTWVLYQNYANQGYTKTLTHAISEDKSVIHTCWTQKGRLFLYDLLKSERDLLPLMERTYADAEEMEEITNE